MDICTKFIRIRTALRFQIRRGNFRLLRSQRIFRSLMLIYCFWLWPVAVFQRRSYKREFQVYRGPLVYTLPHPRFHPHLQSNISINHTISIWITKLMLRTFLLLYVVFHVSSFKCNHHMLFVQGVGSRYSLNPWIRIRLIKKSYRRRESWIIWIQNIGSDHQIRISHMETLNDPFETSMMTPSTDHQAKLRTWYPNLKI